MKGLEDYRNEFKTLWKKWEDCTDKEQESKLDDDLRHILEDMSNQFKISTSVAFNWIWGE